MQRTLYSLKSLRTFLKEERPSDVCVVVSRNLYRKFKWAIKEIGAPKKTLFFFLTVKLQKNGKKLKSLLRILLGSNWIVKA